MPSKNKHPKIVLFGRPNVGKSTLLNCLAEKNIALVSDTPGTTRDANVAQVDWQGKTLQFIDTGGILDPKFLTLSTKKLKKAKKETENNSSSIDQAVQEHSKNNLTNADLILFMVDTRMGLMPQDKEMSLILKKLLIANKKNWRKKIILLANKADSPRLRTQIAEFNKLGLSEPFPISATSGSGTGDLLDLIIKKLPKTAFKKNIISKEDEKILDVAIIGRPNVGKSSLVNSLLGEEKIIVSPIPHTTREPNDTLIEYQGNKINLIDTAGISKSGQKNRKRIKEKKALEKLSIQKSLNVLRKAQIALLVIDMEAGLTHQEAKLVEEISKSKTSFIILANKWDLIKTKDTKAYKEKIYSHLPFATWSPIQFCSALTGSKTKKIFDLILEVNKERQTEISDNALSKFLNKIIKKHSPVKAKGTKKPYIYEFIQEKTSPPLFSIRIGAKDTILESYLGYIENRLREKFGFKGSPVTIYVKKNKRIHGKHEEK